MSLLVTVKIDPTITMMQVEEKPEITYNDVGGCKEQIEKLREVVEMPLFHPEKSSTSVSIHQKVSSCTDLLKRVKLYAPGLWPTAQMPLSFVSSVLNWFKNM